MIAKEQPEWKNSLLMAEKTPRNIAFPAPQLLPKGCIKAEREKSGAGAQVGCVCPSLRGGKGVPKVMLMAPDIPHPKSFKLRVMGGDMAWEAGESLVQCGRQVFLLVLLLACSWGGLLVGKPPQRPQRTARSGV